MAGVLQNKILNERSNSHVLQNRQRAKIKKDEYNQKSLIGTMFDSHIYRFLGFIFK